MLTIQQIAELKQAVKTEMARRSGNGSLASFSGADWEFTIQPESGGRVLAEHGKKVINPLLEVADIPGLLLVEGITPGGETPSGAGDPIPAAFDGALLDKVANYGTEGMTASSSSCRGACSGLCAATCTSTCSGCRGSSGSSGCSG